jgi:hypothetical protein
MDSNLTSKLSQYRQIQRKGVDYILQHLNADGSVGPVEKSFSYYRTPWALASAGEMEAAVRLCEWIRQNQLGENGDFVGVTPRPLLDHYLYTNALLVVGAQMLQQLDLSHQGIQYILSLEDPLSGGFYNYADGASHSDKEDIPFTCGVGLACLMTGEIAAAERVAKWLQQMWSLQPELPERLYFIYSAEKQALVTDFPAEEAKVHVLEAQNPEQRFTVGGIGAAFLARLYMARPRPEYLALAREYQAFAHQQTEQQFEVAQVCKVGWGAALLYQITKEPIYKEWAIKVADYFVETQFPDGHWINNNPLPDGQPEIEIGSEFLVYLDVIISSLQG